MNDAVFRLLVDSGALLWVPRKGFPFQMDASAIIAARHLERVAHYYAKKLVQILRQNSAESRAAALMPWQARDERLTTAVALSLWGEFHIDTSILSIGQPPATLEAGLFVITDLFPRAPVPAKRAKASPPQDSLEGPNLHLVSALTWGDQPAEKGLRTSLGDLPAALEWGVGAGIWPEEARTQWNRFLFNHQLFQDEDTPSPHDGQ